MCSQRLHVHIGNSHSIQFAPLDTNFVYLSLNIHSSHRPSLFPQTAAYGNFTDAKAQELVVSRGKVLDLLRPSDTMVGEGSALQVVCSMEVFGQIRSLQPFRLPGAPTDHLIVGSDSGRIVILAWNKERNVWKKIHQETYGRTGCRRAVPGQYLAIDPRGR